jgi:Tol biopolymer transport system component
MSASRDGKWVMYDSDLQGNADIYRIPSSGGTAQQLTDDARPEYAPDLSPDGSEFAWQRWINGERHLFVKQIDGDSAYEILPVRGDQGVPKWSPDGTAIAAWSHDNERGAVFVMKRETQGKWQRPAWRLDYGQLPRWSPDGRTIAFTRLDGRVQSIPADSGEVTTLYSPGPGDPLATLLVWSRDPDKIWMVGESPTTRGIWSLSVRTGRPRLVVNLNDPMGKTIGPGFAVTESHFYFALNERSSNVRWAELNKH